MMPKVCCSCILCSQKGQRIVDKMTMMKGEFLDDACYIRCGYFHCECVVYRENNEMKMPSIYRRALKLGVGLVSHGILNEIHQS